jgi:hypothetical protein
MMAGPILVVTAVPFWNWLLRPSIRVLNLTEYSLVLLVDDQPVARVEPTSAESPLAGLDLRVLAGPRHLVARRTDGALVDDIHVTAHAGRDHLYAPASPATCFWLETDGYGEQSESSRAIRPLSGSVRFWTLPEIDAWFAPNPDRGPLDRQSSGGVRTALRQGRCSEAPPPVAQ